MDPPPSHSSGAASTGQAESSPPDLKAQASADSSVVLTRNDPTTKPRFVSAGQDAQDAPPTSKGDKRFTFSHPNPITKPMFIFTGQDTQDAPLISQDDQRFTFLHPNPTSEPAFVSTGQDAEDAPSTSQGDQRLMSLRPNSTSEPVFIFTGQDAQDAPLINQGDQRFTFSHPKRAFVFTGQEDEHTTPRPFAFEPLGPSMPRAAPTDDTVAVVPETMCKRRNIEVIRWHAGVVAEEMNKLTAALEGLVTNLNGLAPRERMSTRVSANRG